MSGQVRRHRKLKRGMSLMDQLIKGVAPAQLRNKSQRDREVFISVWNAPSTTSIDAVARELKMKPGTVRTHAHYIRQVCGAKVLKCLCCHCPAGR